MAVRTQLRTMPGLNVQRRSGMVLHFQASSRASQNFFRLFLSIEHDSIETEGSSVVCDFWIESDFQIEERKLSSQIFRKWQALRHNR